MINLKQHQIGESGFSLLNPFYLAAFLWFSVLFLYLLGWSDFCLSLETHLVVFIVYMLVLFMLAGYLLSRRRKTAVREKVHVQDADTTKTTIVFCILLSIGMIIKGSFPILNMSKGLTYTAVNVGIPFISAFASALAMFHSFRLSYLFFSTRRKHYLLEYLSILVCYVLMFQRQNIVVCGLGFALCYLGSLVRHEDFIRKYMIKAIAITFVLLAVGLYIFGAIGNYRFGIWDWNDSSMISALGRMNSGWPKWLSAEYFWFYIYMVTPLANLNNTIVRIEPGNDFFSLIMQLLPSSISSRLGYEMPDVYLAEPSLTASTAFVQPYLSNGMFGMYFYLTVSVILVFTLLYFTVDNSDISYAISVSMCYFLFLTTFDNPSIYLMTSYLLIISAGFLTKLYIEKRIRMARGSHFRNC